jgi:hypothetical protein
MNFFVRDRLIILLTHVAPSQFTGLHIILLYTTETVKKASLMIRDRAIDQLVTKTSTICSFT